MLPPVHVTTGNGRQFPPVTNSPQNGCIQACSRLLMRWDLLWRLQIDFPPFDSRICRLPVAPAGPIISSPLCSLQDVFELFEHWTARLNEAFQQQRTGVGAWRFCFVVLLWLIDYVRHNLSESNSINDNHGLMVTMTRPMTRQSERGGHVQNVDTFVWGRRKSFDALNTMPKNASAYGKKIMSKQPGPWVMTHEAWYVLHWIMYSFFLG